MKNIIIISLLVFVPSAKLNKDVCTDRESCGDDVYDDVWTNPTHFDGSKLVIKADKDVLDHLRDLKIPLKMVDMQLLLNFLDANHDSDVTLEELNKLIFYSDDALKVFDTFLASFQKIDGNDNGELEQEELSQAKLCKPEKCRKSVTLGDYAKIVSKLDENVRDVLNPILPLVSTMSPSEIKNIILKSRTVFMDKDLDQSGGLSLEEYLNQIEASGNEKLASMSHSEKESVFKAVDKDRDGEVSFSEFLRTIPKPTGAQNFEKGLETMFRTGDKDGDGFWSEEEFLAHFTQMAENAGMQLGPEDRKNGVEQAFAELDKDKDGKLSMEEMQHIQKDIQKMQADQAIQGFAQLDKDNNGELSKDELLEVVNVLEQKTGQKLEIDAIMGYLDVNRDGKIQIEEMKRLMPK